MKKIYEMPDIQVQPFEVEDILSTSTLTPPVPGGNGTIIS